MQAPGALQEGGRGSSRQKSSWQCLGCPRGLVPLTTVLFLGIFPKTFALGFVGGTQEDVMCSTVALGKVGGTTCITSLQGASSACPRDCPAWDATEHRVDVPSGAVQGVARSPDMVIPCCELRRVVNWTSNLDSKGNQSEPITLPLQTS